VKNNRSALDGEEDGFIKLQTTKPPDFVEQSYLSEDACRTQCLNDCNCTAYGYDDDIRCLTWKGKLIDIVRFTSGGIDLYIRQAYSELGESICLAHSSIILCIVSVINVCRIYSSTFSPINNQNLC
jgi:hypothetical protein